MAIGIYMDVHIPYPITLGLRIRHVEVVTAQEDWRARLTDPDLLNRVTELGMMLYTHDDDHLVEAARRKEMGQVFGGIIFSRQLHSPTGRCIDALEIIAKTLDPTDLNGRVEYIPF